MLLPQLIIIQVITFVALILFLRLLFLGHLNFALKRLQRLNRENVQKETALTKELEKAKQERLEEVEKGRHEANRLREETKLEVERLKDEIALRAKKEAQDIVAAANKEAERMKQEADAEIQDRAIGLSCRLVSSIFSQGSIEDLHLRFMDEMLAEVGKLEGEALSRVSTDKAEVITAFSLPGEKQEALRKILGEKLGRDIQLDLKVDENIIAGLVINLDKLILDGSLANRLKKAALQIKHSR